VELPLFAIPSVLTSPFSLLFFRRMFLVNAVGKDDSDLVLEFTCLECHYYKEAIRALRCTTDFGVTIFRIKCPRCGEIHVGSFADTSSYEDA
jgi:hypothetical protein